MLIPFLQEMTKVDLRLTVRDVLTKVLYMRARTTVTDTYETEG